MDKKVTVVAVLLGLALVAGVYFIWLNYFKPQAVPPAAPVTETPVSPKGTDLGSELYEKANNPLEGELPESAATVPNPLKEVYKNPFE